MNTLRISRQTVFTLGICIVSALVWLLMNIPFAPRFSLSPYVPTSGMFISAGINVILGIILLLIRQKKRAIFPFFFAAFPVAYLITAYTGHLFLGKDFTGPFFYRKILYDSYFFLVEIFCVSFVAIAFKRSFYCFAPRREAKKMVIFSNSIFREKPVSVLTNFSVILFCSVVLGLMVLLLMTNHVSLPVIITLAWMQILFAVLLGFKEELFFRWFLTHALIDNIPEIKRSFAGLLSLILVAIFWGMYHGLFGEGVGSGIGSAMACFIASLFWGYLTLRNGTIKLGFLGHICIELYGFYLMYLPLLADMGYIK